MIKIKESIVSLFGVAASQAIFFLCLWLIARNSGPEILGVFNYNLSIGMFIGTIFVLRYELACVSNSYIESLKSLVMILVFSSLVLLALVIGLWFLGKQEYLIVVFFSLSFIWHQAIIHYLNSLRAYPAIAAARSIINVLFLGFVFFYSEMSHIKLGLFDAYALIYFFICLVSASIIIYIAKENIVFSRLQAISFLKENYRYPFYILPSTLCASVLTYAMSILLPIWFGATTAGFFALAYRVGFFPVSLIAQSIGGVFRRDMLSAVAAEHEDIQAKQVYFTYVKWLLLLSLIYGVAGVVLFKPCVELFFGTKWGDSVDYYLFMAPLFCLQIIYIPLSQAFLAYRRQKTDFMLNLVMAIMLLFVLYMARVTNLSSFQIVLTFSMTASVVMLGGIFLTYKTVTKYDSNCR